MGLKPWTGNSLLSLAVNSGKDKRADTIDRSKWKL